MSSSETGSMVSPTTGQGGFSSSGGSGAPGTSGTLAALMPRFAR